MENKEENRSEYLLESKKNINDLIRCNKDNQALRLIFLVLDRLNDEEKLDFVNYYIKILN